METLLFAVCGVILVWRLSVRAAFVTHLYGIGEGLRSIPRAFLANIIAMAAARRALQRYLHGARGGALVWDKTEHSFPQTMPAE